MRYITTHDALESIRKEYNRQLPADGLKLAYIEKALNEVPTIWRDADLEVPADDDPVLAVMNATTIPIILEYVGGRWLTDEGLEIETHGLEVVAWAELPSVDIKTRREALWSR